MKVNKTLKLSTIIGIALAASHANAALLASYANGSAADSAAFTNLTTTTGYTATSLSSVGLSTGTAITVGTFGGNSLPAGPTAGSSAGSEWLANIANVLTNTGTPVSTDDYYAFTLTGTGGNKIDPGTLNFDWVLATGTSATGGIAANYQIFAAADGGSFASVGLGDSISGPATSTTMGTLASVSVDLTSLAAATSYEFRIALSNNSTSPRKSLFLQGIQLNGVVAVPEPSSAALLGGLGALLLLRRRRA